MKHSHSRLPKSRENNALFVSNFSETVYMSFPLHKNRSAITVKRARGRNIIPASRYWQTTAYSSFDMTYVVYQYYVKVLPDTRRIVFKKDKYLGVGQSANNPQIVSG